MNIRTCALPALFALALPAALAAAEPLRYEGTPVGNEMRIDGDSSIHKWNCISKIISGAFEVDPAWKSDLTLKSVPTLGPGKAPVCKIIIPARTLKSSSGAPMDNVMMDAMEGKKIKNIEYKLTEMVIDGDVPASGSPVKFKTKGDLTVHGVTKPVSFPITMERTGADALKFAGSCALKMSDFGIKPPVLNIAGVGTITTADDITLAWTWAPALKTEAK